MSGFIKELKNYLEKKKLPGYESHKKMLPVGRIYPSDNGEFKKSSVNVLTFFNDDKFSFFLTKRSEHLSHHSGQISLPGGSFDASDKNDWETAKRETFEEIGVLVTDDNYVGKLSPLIVPVSSFIVQPFVSFFINIPSYVVNEQEVQQIYSVDFNSFFLTSNIHQGSLKNNGTVINYSYFGLENNQVWGLTAMILSEFRDIVFNLKSIN